MRTYVGKAGFALLDEREPRLRSRWFHYSSLDVFSQFFRSPDWQLWQAGRYEDAILVMLTSTEGIARNADRARAWSASGVQVVRAQVITETAATDLGHPANYLITYLGATHPDEDTLLVDETKAVTAGIRLPDLDFLIHDDDLVMTKYEGEPGVPYRDLYLNGGQDPDDARTFAELNTVSRTILACRNEIAFAGRVTGLDLLARIRPEARR